MRRTKYTAEVLAPIVASSRSLADVIRKLGLRPTGGNHRMISTRIRLAKLDTSHFGGKLRAQIRAVSRGRLEQIVADSRSVAAVLVALGLPVMGRTHHEVTRRLRELAIDTGHFTGAAWARGFTRETHEAIDRVARKLSFSDEDLFVENGPVAHGPMIVRRLVAKGLPYCCAICGIAEWCGERLVLHLDHINGVHNDHRLENLTDTYCNKARESAACYTTRTASVVEW